MREGLDSNLQQSVWPYPERSGVNTERHLSEILSDQEKTLSQEDYEATKAFAHGLFYGSYAEKISCDAKRDLEEIYQASANESISDFKVDYFQTEDGRNALSKLGIFSEDPEIISQTLSDTSTINENLSSKERKQIAADSLNWYKGHLANQLLKPASEDENFEDIHSASVNYNPSKLLEKIEDLQAYRRFFREVKRNLKLGPESELRNGKKAVLAAYRARVNEMIAGLYMSTIDLAQQLQNYDPDNLSERLKDALPAVSATFLQAREDRVYDIETLAGRFSRRLDFIRNGAAWTGQMDFSPISAELSNLAVALEAESNSDFKEAEVEYEVVKRLETERWDAEQIRSFTSKVIGEWDLLSSVESDWNEVEERDGPAEDDKWQVVISPKVKNLSVNGSKKAIIIPESFDRPLVQESPAGVISLVSHELEHLVQNEAAYLIGKEIPLAKIKGRHVSTIKELGAITQEREAQERFGAKRDTNLHYLRALKVKLAGGNKIQTARAFYDSYRSNKPEGPENDHAARLLAVDRILRFYRQGENESQPLDYIEQELLRRKMESTSQENRNQILILGSVFDLPDLARLTKTGLIHYPKGLPYNVSEDVWRVFCREHPDLITQDSSS